ncbi:MAG: OprO/OprP family phosphate-selective porin [Chitinispirillaceae bacterium]|jgi:phosphate-selective porin|nr:OprO/OprP family phosphate-selective porin [Chitinispirillaceae bacterium]
MFRFIIAGLIVSSSLVYAQTDEQLAELSGKVDGLNESFLETKGTVDKLAKIKVSGYIQAQYRFSADTMGNSKYKIGDFAGGAFPEHSQAMLQVRRGRVKVAHETELSQMVVQVDCIPKGVTIKDAYLRFTEPWIKSLAIKFGVFDRPFGYEISNSSSMRESPERSRLFQTLFPGERDLGVSLEMFPSEKLPEAVQYFNLKAGLFNGNGIADETDDNKDFIGRLGVTVPLTGINLAIDGGVSAYMGKVTNTDTTGLGLNTGVQGNAYEFTKGVFTKKTGQLDNNFNRSYMGGDLQLYYDLPVIGGFSLRGEYIQGTQPGTASSSGFYNAGRNSKEALYSRNFSGFYGMYVQNIGSKVQGVVKHDFYDPNTDISGSDINKASGCKVADIAYTTTGLGLVYYWNADVKFVACYDIVKNELAASDIDSKYDYSKDLGDNVFTFRIQYKF